MTATLHFQVTNEAGQRLDRVLSLRLAELSRGAIQKAIAAGHCHIDGLAVTAAAYKLRAGQEVRLELPPAGNPLQAEAAELDVLWHDERLLVCNKPAGLTVHPCPSCPEGTLVHRLLFHFPQLARLDGLRPGIVHRLDKDTSGLLLVALDEATRLRLSQAFARREVHKTYLALVQGVPPDSGQCREAIGRHPTAKIKMAVVPEARGGKAALSQWRVLWAAPDRSFALLAVRIHTGRTHQIRVHMQHVGHPLLGDALYAPEAVRRRAPRQMLHAWDMALAHPWSGQPMHFSCPLPQDMLDTAVIQASRMQRLVVTGNPGCGKSSVCAALDAADIPVISADAIVHELYAPHGAMSQWLAHRRDDLLAKDGSVDRALLRPAMRQDAVLRKDVEHMAHALVRDRVAAFWEEAEAQGHAVAAAEIPLYYECGWHVKTFVPQPLCLCITCPQTMRRQRVMTSRGWSAAHFDELESWQWPEQRKAAASALCLENTGSPEQMQEAVQALLTDLHQRQDAARAALRYELRAISCAPCPPMPPCSSIPCPCTEHP